MPRYEVFVNVVYRVTADSAEQAQSIIEEGAEFPVVPYDDETYCSEVNVEKVEAL